MESTKAIFDWGASWVGEDKAPYLHSILGLELKIAVEKIDTVIVPIYFNGTLKFEKSSLMLSVAGIGSNKGFLWKLLRNQGGNKGCVLLLVYLNLFISIYMWFLIVQEKKLSS